MLFGRMNRFQGPVQISLLPSRWLQRVLLTLHVLVGCTLLLAYPMSGMRNFLLLAVAAHLPWSLRAARRVAITGLELDAAQRWHVLFCDGRSLVARLTAAAWVSPYLTTLDFVCADGSKRQVLLLPDMLDADAFRRLRVRLRRGDLRVARPD